MNIEQNLSCQARRVDLGYGGTTVTFGVRRLRQAFQAVSSAGARCGRTNELLARREAERFASCTILHIDPRNGQVTGTSVGHVPMLCAHKDGSHDVYTRRRARSRGGCRRKWWGDLYELCPDDLVNALNNGVGHLELTQAVKRARALKR